MKGSQGGACARLRLAPAGRPTGTTDWQRHTQSHEIDSSKHANQAVSDISAGRPKAVQTMGSTSKFRVSIYEIVIFELMYRIVWYAIIALSAVFAVRSCIRVAPNLKIMLIWNKHRVNSAGKKRLHDMLKPLVEMALLDVEAERAIEPELLSGARGRLNYSVRQNMITKVAVFEGTLYATIRQYAALAIDKHLQGRSGGSEGG